MREAIAWLNGNWFSLVQSLGIIASILLTTTTMRRDRKSRRIGDYLALTSEHRELWGDLNRRRELARVVSPEVDLLAEPLSTAEEEFLLLVIVHFHTGWLLARQGSLVDIQVLARDAGAFFRLPLPRLVWNRTRSVRDPLFVAFVDAACARPKRRRHRIRLCLRHFNREARRRALKAWTVSKEALHHAGRYWRHRASRIRNVLRRGLGLR